MGSLVADRSDEAGPHYIYDYQCDYQKEEKP
jgi:hypothetical protein